MTLAEVFELHRDRIFADLRVCVPATVVKFDAARQLADVQPCLSETHTDESGAEVGEPLPPIYNVPVQFPGTAAFALTFDVQPGDSCLLVFADRSLDKWIGAGAVVDPADPRRHHLADAVALLGVRAAGALGSVDPDCAALRHASGNGVRVRESTVALGSAEPVDFVALASKVEARLSALETAANGHVHSGGVLAGALTGATTAPIVPGDAVGSVVVKAD